MKDKVDVIARRIVAEAADKMSDSEKSEVIEWAKGSLMVVTDKSLSKTQKLKFLQEKKPSKPVLVILMAMGKVVKQHTWDDQSWARRLAFSGLTLGALAFGGEAAGIAALGGAVGVPLFLISAAGASLLGVVVDEMIREKNVG